MLRIFPFFLGAAIFAGAASGQSPAVGDPRPRLPAALGGGSVSSAVDLNRDGRVDLLRAEGSQLRVLLQGIDGAFSEHPAQPPLDFAATGPISVLAPGRLDGDPHLDVVVGLVGGPDEVLHNDGRGVLTPVSPSPIPPSMFQVTVCIVVADLDQRAGEDLLVLAANAPPRLLLSTAPGSLAYTDATANLPNAAAGSHDAADAADFDLDGDVDLVLGQSSVAPTVVLRNNGVGDFRGSPVVVPGATPPVRHLIAVEVTRDPWPDLLIAPDGTGPQPVFVLAGGPGLVFSPVPAGAPLADGFADLAAADVDRDGAVDVVALQSDGALWLGRGPGDGTFPQIDLLLPAGPRRTIALVDVEGDGDADVWVPGIGLEDALLLGDGQGAFVDTEDRTAPTGARRIGRAVAAVDATGEGDPDLVLFGRDGGAATWRNDGSGRFAEDPTIAPPSLPAGGVYTDVRAVRLSPGGPARDLVVLGQPSPFHPPGLRVLRWRTGTGYVDASAQLLSQSQAGRVLTVLRAAAFGRSMPQQAVSDLVLGDSAGMVTIHRLGAGGYTEVTGAVPFPHAGAVLDVLIGDLDGDRAEDLVVVTSGGLPEVHVASGPGGLSFRHVPGAVASPTPATTGLLADLTGDGVLDLLLATPRSGIGLSLLAGVGDGTFNDVTARYLGGLPAFAAVTALVQLDERRVAVGREGEEDVLLARSASSFRLDPVPMRGSRATRRLLAEDLDLDGDQDLVVVRADSEPAVLPGLDTQLAARGLGQNGRVLRLLVAGPSGGTGFLLFSPLTTRSPLAGLGILRLVSPVTVAAVRLGAAPTVIDLVVPPTLPPLDLPLQLVTFDPLAASVAIGNLELATVTAH